MSFGARKFTRNHALRLEFQFTHCTLNKSKMEDKLDCHLPRPGKREIRVSVDSGISLSFCDEEETLSKAEQIYFKTCLGVDCESGEIDDPFVINNLLNFASFVDSHNEVLDEDEIVSDEDLKEIEERYMKIINDCLQYNEDEEELSVALLRCSDVDDANWDNISDIFSSLEDKYSDIHSSYYDLVIEDEFASDNGRKCHERVIVSKEKLPYEHNPPNPINGDNIRNSKLSRFVSRVGTTLLSVINPMAKISNGIPLAKEVKHEASSPKKVSSVKRTISIEGEPPPDIGPSTSNVRFSASFSYQNSSTSCFERIMRERNKRNEMKRRENIEILNDLGKKSKNTEIENLKHIIEQLESVQDQHLTLAKEIDKMKKTVKL